MFAAKGGHAEILRELLRAVPGVDAGAADPRTGVTAIAVARQNQRTAAVAALVDHTGGGGDDGSHGSGGGGETKAPAWVRSMSSARYDKGLDPFGAATRRRVAQLVAQFTGRDWLAQRVVEATATATATATAATAAAEHGATLVVVYGDSGTGKTSFVCRVLDDDLNAALPPESP